MRATAASPTISRPASCAGARRSTRRSPPPAAAPIARVDPDVLDILRLGVYQMRHRDRLPAHAVVSDAVALTRLAGHTSAAGFVNAVLRRVATHAADAAGIGRRAVAGAGAAAGLDALATRFAHPEWLVARWTARLGVDAAIAWMRFDNDPAPLTLRALPSAGHRARRSPARLASAGVSVTPTRWAPAGLVVTGGNPLDQASATAGFVVQDEASQVVGELAAAWPARRRLDVCAAPGRQDAGAVGRAPTPVGSSPAIAGRAACGCSATRWRAPAPAASRSCSTTPRVRCPTATSSIWCWWMRRVPGWARCGANRISSGGASKRSSRRWPRCRRRMLAHAARVVAPGGVLVYATCSSEPDENDAVADAFLAAHPAFEPAGPPPAAPAGVGGLLAEDGRLHTSPVTHGLEAFFAAAFRRRG